MDYTVLGLGALEQGFIYAIMAIGVFIALRILDIPDLTCDGSFITGAAVSVMITLTGHPYLSLLLAILAGGIAGIMTGLMITKLNVQPLLAGIITMTGLFSINLIIMDEKPTVSINDKNNIFSFFFDFFSFGRKLDPIQRKLITIPVLFVIVLIISIALIWFLKTKTGLALRATGDNEAMVKASSINADAMKILGLALANGVIALSGAVLSQHQNFADAKAGTGMVVVGIASIIIGEALFGRQSLLNNLVSAILGAMIYRIFISLALQFGLPASYFKLLSAFIVVFALLIPLLKS
ncbi:MAG: ABC transporter permease, partial [Clostridiales Family XIII bacterium]|nr:ABC transporter permease [Clostridiales Family XIII bacterium]